MSFIDTPLRVGPSESQCYCVMKWKQQPHHQNNNNNNNHSFGPIEAAKVGFERLKGTIIEPIFHRIAKSIELKVKRWAEHNETWLSSCCQIAWSIKFAIESVERGTGYIWNEWFKQETQVECLGEKSLNSTQIHFICLLQPFGWTIWAME